MLQWVLAPEALLACALTLVLGGASLVLAPSRGVGPMMLVALLACAVGTPIAAVGAVTLRGGLASALAVLVVVGVDAIVLGLLVGRGTRVRALLAATLVLLALQVPLAILANVWLQCHVGHYCPGL
jgi:hypothetical protein